MDPALLDVLSAVESSTTKKEVKSKIDPKLISLLEQVEKDLGVSPPKAPKAPKTPKTTIKVIPDKDLEALLAEKPKPTPAPEPASAPAKLTQTPTDKGTGQKIMFRKTPYIWWGRILFHMGGEPELYVRNQEVYDINFTDLNVIPFAKGVYLDNQSLVFHDVKDHPKILQMMPLMFDPDSGTYEEATFADDEEEDDDLPFTQYESIPITNPQVKTKEQKTGQVYYYIADLVFNDKGKPIYKKTPEGYKKIDFKKEDGIPIKLNDKHYLIDEDALIYSADNKEFLGDYDVKENAIHLDKGGVSPTDDTKPRYTNKKIATLSKRPLGPLKLVHDTTGYEDLFKRDPGYQPKYVWRNDKPYILGNRFLFQTYKPFHLAKAKYQVIGKKINKIQKSEGDGLFQFEIRGHDLMLRPFDIQVETDNEDELGLYDFYNNMLVKKSDDIKREELNGELVMFKYKTKAKQASLQGEKYVVFGNLGFVASEDQSLTRIYKGRSGKWKFIDWDDDLQSVPLYLEENGEEIQVEIGPEGQVWWRHTNVNRRPDAYLRIHKKQVYLVVDNDYDD